MKVFVRILSLENPLNVEINELGTVDELNSAVNFELNSNEGYYYILDKLVCAEDRPLVEMGFREECVVYAVKKSDRLLKRQIDNSIMNQMLNRGLFNAISKEDNKEIFDGAYWKNGTLSEIQRSMQEALTEDPSILEPLFLQPQVELLIQNPTLLNTFYRAFPQFISASDKNPNQVRFATDTSQFLLVREMLGKSDELYRTTTMNGENMRHVMDTKRYRHMMDTLLAMQPESSIVNMEQSINELIRCGYGQQSLQTLSACPAALEAVLRCCPYAASKDTVSDMASLVPGALAALGDAIANTTNPTKIIDHMRNNPIEVDGELLERLVASTAAVQDCTADGVSLAETVCRIEERLQSALPSDQKAVPREYQDELKMLQEMGYTDVEANINALDSEYGNVNRALLKLAQ